MSGSELSELVSGDIEDGTIKIADRDKDVECEGVGIIRALKSLTRRNGNVATELDVLEGSGNEVAVSGSNTLVEVDGAGTEEPNSEDEL